MITIKNANKTSHSNRNLSVFDLQRRRFGTWGVIKGRLLAELIGEEKALSMFQAVRNREGLKRLILAINFYFKAELSFVEPKNISSFLQEKKEKILQELDIPVESYEYMHLLPDGRMKFHADWSNHFDFKYGNPWGQREGLIGWSKPWYISKSNELYY